MSYLSSKYKIILGSKSPRRSELLQELMLDFEVRSPEADEIIPDDLPPIEVPEYLARVKAESLKKGMQSNELIITADTLVILGETILGKPTDKNEAVKMLKDLSGKKHLVVTGVCLLSQDFCHSFHEVTEVTFNDFSEDEINFYIDQFQPFDKAGSYGIQEWIGLAGVQKINGCFFNVIGLPTPRLFQELKKVN